jgi:uncharacterized membrane protein
MEYKVSVGNFDRKRHSRSIEKINNAHSGIEKELYFKNIARHILSEKGFEKVTTGPSTSYRVLAYIPLILGSFWFGIKGAVSIATGVILLFLPYVMEHWHAFSLENFHEILEGVLFVVIALTLGVFLLSNITAHPARLSDNIIR